MSARAACPSCGYTKEDADFHLDHHLCNLSGKAPWEEAAQPAAGTTPPNHELIAQLYSLVGEHEEGCSALKSTIIGGLGCTCNDVRHITHGDVRKCIAGDHSECESFPRAAQPAAGTTPLAERHVCKPSCHNPCMVLEDEADKKARAVAPVETPDAKDKICTEIQDIMRVYREQEASAYGVDTPGGLEHMGDVWSLLSRWDRELEAK